MRRYWRVVWRFGGNSSSDSVRSAIVRFVGESESPQPETAETNSDTQKTALASKQQPQKTTVTRHDLLQVSPKDTAYILKNILTKPECLDVIKQAENFGLEDINAMGYPRDIRTNDRVSIMSAELAELMFQRARPFLGTIEKPSVEDVKSGTKEAVKGLDERDRAGTWFPDSINPCFRVCRYRPGGHFSCHHDGGFEVDKDLTSMQTFMIYLTTIPEHAGMGGPTSFYTEEQEAYELGEDRHRICAYYPEAGSCLAFRSKIMHDGGKLLKGEKWILRSEVMYRRLGGRHCADGSGKRSEDVEQSVMTEEDYYRDFPREEGEGMSLVDGEKDVPEQRGSGQATSGKNEGNVEVGEAAVPGGGASASGTQTGVAAGAEASIMDMSLVEDDYIDDWA